MKLKLGEIHLSKYKRCKNYKIMVANIQHTKCFRCYIESKYNNKKEKKKTNIEEFFVRHNDDNEYIKQLGYVDPVKYAQNIRLLSVNPRGFGPDTIEKITMLKRSKERLMFDGVFFSSPNRLWDTRRKDLM